MQRSVQTTVVIAAWGGYVGTQLSEAVESVRDQDRRARILVVDNASDVHVPELAAVETVRSQRRLTLGAARNLGLDSVETPYVLFWDADDVMLPGTLGVLEEALDLDPSLVAFGAAIIESPSGKRHRWPRPWVRHLLRWPSLFAFLDGIWSLYPTTGATIMRTASVREAGGYAATDSGQDWVLGVSLAFRGGVGWTERPGRVYRIHDQSVTARHASFRNLVQKARAVRERLRSDAGLPRWVRSMLPIVQIGQYFAIGLHVGLGYSRRLRRSRQRGGGGAVVRSNKRLR